jgi:gas vesicle protein
MKKLFIGLLLFAVLGLVAAVGNETSGKDVRQAVMEMHAAQLECRVDFLVVMLEHSEEYTGDSYSKIIGNLESSMDEVKQAAEENNFDAFLDAVRKTKGYFREAVQTIHDARVEALQNAGKNKSELIAQMKEDFDSARKEFVDCHVKATRKRISAEVHMNMEWMEQAKNNIKNLKEKGYKTNKLEDIVDEAEKNTEDMEKIAEKEQDVDKLLEERRAHWEHHLYLWAKYHSERLNLFLDRIAEKTDGYEGQVEEIKDILDKAVSIGDDEYYNLEEFREARSLILTASEKIRALVDEINTGKGEGS